MIESVDTFGHTGAAAQAASDDIAAALTAAVEARGAASFVATGGSSPAPVYDRLCEERVPWRNVQITLSDERWVPPESPESNERMLRARLLIKRAYFSTFVPLKSKSFDPVSGARRASTALAGMPRPFDITLLGMGEDGHIASLFPKSPLLPDGLNPPNSELCIAVPSGGDDPPPQIRVTLTMPVLNASRRIILFLIGAAKRATLDAALAGDDVAEMPVRGILTGAAPVRIICAER